jgi:hypothetical protein
MENSKPTAVNNFSPVKHKGNRFCSYHIVGSTLTFQLDTERGMIQTFVSGKFANEVFAPIPPDAFFLEMRKAYRNVLDKTLCKN